MMKKTFFLAFSLLIAIAAYSQSDSCKAKCEPVSDVFGAPTLIDNQTTAFPFKGQKQILIQHRFTDKIDKWNNLWGIYGSSNIRMGFAYGITEKLAATVGIEKNGGLYDLGVKYLLHPQCSGGCPVSVAAYVNMTVDSRDKDVMDPLSYKKYDRFSYFSQLIVSHKVSDALSLQVAGSFIHINKVDLNAAGTQPNHSNDNLGIMAGGKLKLYGDYNLVAEYSQSYRMEKYKNQDDSKPVFGVGLETSTGTHTFQFFVSNTSKLSNQYGYVYSHKNIPDDLTFGFNITVKL